MTNQIFDEPLTGSEKKYGPNELNHLEFCLMCCEKVPVFIRRVVTDDCFSKKEVIEYHCRKCFFNGNKDGTLIKRFEPVVLEFRTPVWMIG